MHVGGRWIQAVYEIARWDNRVGMAVWSTALQHGIWLKIKNAWKALLDGKLNSAEWELWAQTEQQEVLRVQKEDDHKRCYQEKKEEEAQSGWQSWSDSHDEEETQWKASKWKNAEWC